jgi:hypothetical protein
MSDYEYQGLGYRRDLENVQELLAGAQVPESFYCGDIDPRTLGEPSGVSEALKIEDQSQINSCGGNSITTILEACIWHQTQGQVALQLSRMFAYINGQQCCNPPIVGDNGLILMGGIKSAQTRGVCLESSAPYTNFYYTQFSQAAYAEAKQYTLQSYIPITHVDQLYEGFAKRIGGAYFGMNWTGQFKNPFSNGFVDTFKENAPDWYGRVPGGFHAVCFVDWSKYRDSSGYPRLTMHNSHSIRYGDMGKAHWSRDAVQSALEQPNTLAFFLSDMDFIRPRFDFKRQHWTSV